MEIGAEMDEILCSKWNPTQEYLAIASREFVILLDPELILKAEEPIDDNDMTFPSEDVLPEQKLIKEASISWRGDGEVSLRIIVIMID